MQLSLAFDENILHLADATSKHRIVSGSHPWTKSPLSLSPTMQGVQLVYMLLYANTEGLRHYFPTSVSGCYQSVCHLADVRDSLLRSHRIVDEVCEPLLKNLCGMHDEQQINPQLQEFKIFII